MIRLSFYIFLFIPKHFLKSSLTSWIMNFLTDVGFATDNEITQEFDVIGTRVLNKKKNGKQGFKVIQRSYLYLSFKSILKSAKCYFVPTYYWLWILLHITTAFQPVSSCCSKILKSLPTIMLKGTSCSLEKLSPFILKSKLFPENSQKEIIMSPKPFLILAGRKH